MLQSRSATFSPSGALLASFCVAIALGSLLLSLPFAQAVPCSYVDIIFTATSATCITGLFTIPLSNFTFFGHCIILLLIQIGALGLITLSICFISLFANISLKQKIMAGKIIELNVWNNVTSILFFTFIFTIIFEGIGAFLLYWPISNHYDPCYSIFVAIFHAVSAFCNAGIFITNDNSFMFNPTTSLITLILIFVGGFGFITWHEIINYCRFRWHKKPYSFSLHSKIIIYCSLFFIACSTLLFWLIQLNSYANSYILNSTFLTSLFQAISFKSAGFILMPLTSLSLGNILLIMTLAFIGSAPGSTGSGIKITSIVLYLAAIKAAIAGQANIVINGRTIAYDQILRAIAIVSLGLFWIALTTMILVCIEKQPFLTLLFEAVSAFTNLGLSFNITPHLSLYSKYIIIISMITGRIGSLTLIIALREVATQTKNESIGIIYPEERIMLS